MSQGGNIPMNSVYDHLFEVMWLAWAAYWWVLSRSVKTTVRREPVLRRLAHLVPLGIAGLLLWLPHVPVRILEDRFLPRTPWVFGAGALLAAAGLLFAVWARVHIGANWSGIVTIKQDHELIRSGPYAIVRHPIYSGLLLAFVGSAVARGEWRGVLAVAIVFGSFWPKLRFEERWMRQQFGQAYDDYRQRVRALIPFVL